ncbi:MAG: pyridoxal-phosphate dependent enzyme [Myxococcota bacterium]|nr:pyridoxal-phosphate dependent enzyme [Myxococcota bacterium]
MRKVYNNVLEAVGDTPIVRLNSVTKGIQGKLYAKLEMLNPAGSIKDRLALQIVADAEADGTLKPGGKIVEGTSGNTGAGLAMVAAVKGYTCTFVMPDKQSEEKRAALRAYGSKVVITPTAVEPEDERSYYSVSKKLAGEPGAFYANQYHNPSNPRTHLLSTGPEIWDQMGEELDAIICGLGTGGTISGIGEYFKKTNPKVQIIGVDPVGSVYFDYFHTGQMTQPYTYVVEGIGEDFMPSTVQWEFIDDVVRVNDVESFQMTRRIVQEEGIFCGGSGGSVVAGALKWIERNDKPDLKVLVILPDSGSRYMSKIFNDSWMREQGFLDAKSSMGRVRDLVKHMGTRKLVSVGPDATAAEVIGLMKMKGVSQVPVLDDGQIVGILSETALLEHSLKSGGENSKVQDLIQMDYCTIEDAESVEVLTDLFRRYKVAFVVSSKGNSHKVHDIITKIDLIDYIAARNGGRK